MSMVWMVRHGPVDVPLGMVYGHTDVEPKPCDGLVKDILSAIGQNEVQTIYSSDLQRCALPAQMLADRLHIPCHTMPELREQFFGSWETMTWDWVRNHDYQRGLAFFRDWVNQPAPDGESFVQMLQRLREACSSICQHDGNGLIVTHSGPIRGIRCLYEQWPLRDAFSCQVDYGQMHSFDKGQLTECLFFSDNGYIRI